MSVVDDSFNQPMKPEEHAAMPLAGGIMQQGYQCGMLWGAALAAGAQAYRQWGASPQAETAAVIAAQRALEAFRARTGEINCAEIIELNWKTPSKGRILKFFLKGGPIGCFRLAANYAPIARDAIDAALSDNALSDNPIDPPASPISCAAMLAKQMGASELHAVMAAGLAGGIGLSGGACGALGAAIWLIGVKSSEQGDGQISFNDPAASAAIEKFLESADYEFECAKIVGRKFENAADHAAYVRAGGCAKIIEALAACLPTDRALDAGDSGEKS